MLSKPSEKSRVGSRMLYLGFDKEWTEKYGSERDGAMSIHYFERVADIPANEPPPDVLRVRGEAVSDDELGLLLSQRDWRPMMIKVVGRWNSRYSTFLGLRGKWIVPFVIVVGLAGCVLLVLGGQLLKRMLT